MNSDDIEKTGWFKGTVLALAFLTAFGLCNFAGLWPSGPRSISAAAIYFFSLLGLQRLYAGIFGVLVIMLRNGHAKGGRRAI